MITEEEYNRMLARVAEITALDPDPDSELAKELLALADALEEYENLHFPVKDAE